MNNHSEQGSNLETGIKRLGNNLQIRATLALANIIDSLPHIKKKNIGRALAVGTFGLLEAACAVKPVLQPTPVIEAKTPESTPLPGLFFDVLSADQKSPNPIPQDLLTQLNNNLTNNNRLNPNHSSVTVSEIVGVEAIDPINTTKTANFFFVETNRRNQSENNDPHFVMFKDGQGHVIVDSYKAFASIGPDGQVDVVYKTGDNQAFFTVHLAQKIAQNDPDFQNKIESLMNKGAITGMDFSNPQTGDKVTLNNAAEPGILARAIHALQQNAVFSIPVANAAEPQTNIATPQSPSTPAATVTQEATATATTTVEPPTATPDAGKQIKDYLTANADALNAISQYASAEGFTMSDVQTRLLDPKAETTLKDYQGNTFKVLVDSQTKTPLFIKENGLWQAITFKYMSHLTGIPIGAEIVDYPEVRTLYRTQFDVGLIPSGWGYDAARSGINGTLDFSHEDHQYNFASSIGYPANNLFFNSIIFPAVAPNGFGSLNKQQAIDWRNNYITKVMTYYKGKIKYFTVVNEPRGMGLDEIEAAYQTARKVNPDAFLIFNETDNHDPRGKYVQTTVSIGNYLYQKGLIDAIGVQGHLTYADDGGSYAAPTEDQIFNVLSLYKAPIILTEVDASLQAVTKNRLATQSEWYTKLINAALRTGRLKGIFFFGGFPDHNSFAELGQHITNASPTFWDDNLNPKLAYYDVIKSLFKQLTP